jgi:hypothetical protein
LNNTGTVGINSNISSGATTGDAITITGFVNTATSSASTNANGVTIYPTSGGTQTINASGGGNIAITGTASSATTNSVELNYTNIYAAGGNITIDAGTQTIEYSKVTGVATVNIGGTSSSSLAGEIKIIANNVSYVAGGSTVYQNAAKLYIEPKSTSFSSAQTLASTSTLTNLSYLALGKSGNTAGITVAKASTIKGDIDIWGGAVTMSTNQVTTGGGDITVVGSGAYTGAGTLNANGSVSITALSFAGTGAITSAGDNGVSVVATGGNITTGATLTANTSAIAPVLLKATANILVNNALQSNGGPVTLWADSDELAQGGILMDAGSSIVSNGGDVTLGGGNGATAALAPPRPRQPAPAATGAPCAYRATAIDLFVACSGAAQWR